MVKGLETTLDGEPLCKAMVTQHHLLWVSVACFPTRCSGDTSLSPSWMGATAPGVHGRCRSRCAGALLLQMCKQLPLQMCRGAPAPDVQGCSCSRCAGALLLQMCRSASAPDVQRRCCSRCARALLLQMCRGSL